MKNTSVENITAGSFSVLLHILLLGLFVIGMDSQSIPKPIAQPEQVEIVQATMMDEANILQEMVRQQEVEDNKRNAEQERQDLVQQRLDDTQKELARKELEYQDQQERAKIEQQQLETKAKQEKEKIAKLEQDRKQEEIKQQQAVAERKIAEEKRKNAEQERKVAEEKQKKAEQDRKHEEELKSKAEQERKAAEKKKQLAEADRKAEEDRKLEAEKERKAEEALKLKAETDRKKAEELKLKAEDARKAEEARKVEAERKAQIAEADRLLQDSLASEQQEQESKRIAGVVDQYSLMIKQRIKRNWLRPGIAESGLQSTLRVTLLPSGDVKQVIVVKSSGNAIFDRSAESAVYRAAPWPQPTDPKAAAALRDFQFIFKPE